MKIRFGILLSLLFSFASQGLAAINSYIIADQATAIQVYTPGTTSFSLSIDQDPFGWDIPTLWDDFYENQAIEADNIQGYKFNGWWTLSTDLDSFSSPTLGDCKIKCSALRKVDASSVLAGAKTAGGTPLICIKHAPVSYKIKYLVDGNSHKETSAQYDKAVTIESFPAKTGFHYPETWTASTGQQFAPGASVKGSDFNVPDWYADGVVITQSVQTVTNDYTVSFNGNGGSGAMTAMACKYGIQYELTSNSFAMAGSAFAGWSRTPNGNKDFADGARFSNLTNEHNAVVTLYARWEKNSHTVTFDNRGADLNQGIKSMSANYNDKLNDLDDDELPRKTGYDFGGYFDGEGTQYWSDEGVFLKKGWPIDASATVYAQWKPHSYSITYDGFDGTDYPTTANYGEDVKLPAPEKTGCAFDGWTVSAGLASKAPQYRQSEGSWTTIANSYTKFMADKDNPVQTIWVRNLNTNDEASVTLKANWQERNYKIKLSFSGANNNPTEELSVPWHGKLPKISVVPEYKSTEVVFVGYQDAEGKLWYGPDGQPTAAFAEYLWDKDDDLTLTAVNGGFDFYITYEVNSKYGGSGTAPAKETWNSTNVITLANGEGMVNPGFRFVGWDLNLDTLPANVKADMVGGGSPSFTDLGITKDQRNTTLYAIWKDMHVTLQLSTQGGVAMTNSVPVKEMVYVDGEKYELLPDCVRPRYQFNGWFTAAVGGEQITKDSIVSFASVPTLYAQWTPDTFTIAYNGNGATGGEMTNQTFYFDIEQALDANQFVRTGYDFDGWVTNLSDTVQTFANGEVVSNLTAVVGATVNFYALWQPHHYTLAFNANGGTGEMDSQRLAYDEEYSLPDPGYEFTPPRYSTFVGWSSNKSATTPEYHAGDKVSCLSTADGATVTLYAIWAYDVGEISKILDCNNLMFTNQNGSAWAEDKAVFHHGTSSMKHDAFKEPYLYVEVFESGILTFWWKGVGDNKFPNEWNVRTNGVNLAAYSLSADQDWTQETLGIVASKDNPVKIMFCHNDELPVWIDNVTWTPGGAGGEPTPGEAVAVAGANLTDGKFVLSINDAASGVDYGVWTNANLLTDQWGLMGEPKQGTDEALTFEWTILPEYPQLFFKVHQVEYK